MLGVSTQTIRNWTDQGLIRGKRSKSNGYRSYLKSEVERVATRMNLVIQKEPRMSAAAYAKKLPETDTIYVIDFFCGCGGVSAGLTSIRQSHLAFHVLAGIDIDAKSLRSYEENIDAPGICADIREIAENPSSLESLIKGFDPDKCRPLLFAGCAPCQGFSAHRKKDKRNDPRNSLMSDFAKIVEHFLPDYVFMENVPEVLTGRYAKYFRRSEAILRRAGYKLSMDTCDLSRYGIAQRRRRAVLLGGLNKSPSIPQETLPKDAAKTVREAISHLHPIAAGETCEYDPLHRCPAHTQRIIERIKATPPNGGDRRHVSQDSQLKCHRSVDESTTPGFTDVYGRLRWDTPSVTITAKSSTPSCGRFLHPEQHRNISIREAAILQGFPQWYKFVGPLTHIYRQIGEAVPPLFASHIGWAILDAHRPPPAAKLVSQKAIERHCDSPILSKFGPIRFIDAFCGCGGLSLGLAAAGLNHAFSFDIDSDAVSSFKESLRKSAEVWDISNEDLIAKLNSIIDERPWVLSGGPPCQGFSQQRRGEDNDPRNNLVINFGELVSRVKKPPAAIILENVTYLDSPRGRDIFMRYQKLLEHYGYISYRHDLNSAEYGVPQLRRRIITVSVLSELAFSYSGPEPICYSRWPSVGEVLSGLPEPTNDPNIMHNHTPSREGPANIRRIGYVDMGKGRMSIPTNLQLPCHLKYGGHLDVYGRLDWFGQARTITGGFDSFTRGEFAHPIRNRSITAREAARIQGFPDWFSFQGNKQSVRRQIGNAVPPPVALAIGKAIRFALLEEKGG